MAEVNGKTIAFYCDTESLYGVQKIRNECGGDSFSAAMREILSFWPCARPLIREKIASVLPDCGLSPADMLCNLAMARLGELAAKLAFEGIGPDALDLAQGADPEAVYQTAYQEAFQRLEMARVRNLLDLERAGGPLALSDDDRAFLISKKAGQSWLESEQYLNESLAVMRKTDTIKALIPGKQIKASDHFLASLFDRRERGNISDAEIVRILEKIAEPQ